MNKSFKIFSLSILALVVLMSMVSAETIFSDSFEDGNLSDWNVTGSGDLWNVVEDGPTSNIGNWHVEAIDTDSNTILERTIDTIDYKTIKISYYRQLGVDWEASDEFKVSWYDGSDWTILEETLDTTPNDTDYSLKSFDLPEEANNNANFKIKFECDTEASDEFCRLDDLLIEGTEIVEPEEIIECSATGDPGNDLSVEIDDISVINGFGDDEEWLPLDEVEIDIVIENDNNDYNIKDIEVAWGLYNKDTGKWYIDDEEKDFKLKDGDEKTITVKFRLDDDIDELADDDYVFYVWANGLLDDDSDDGVDLCASDSQDIDMIIEDDFVILDDIQLLPETVSCGNEVQITADVWNIGDDDQDDVYVVIYNKELGINKKVEIGDIDAFEDKNLDATITFPDDAEEKSYNLAIWVYNDNDEVYENDYDDQEAEFFVSITVEEGSCSTVPTASITASLQSDAKAGEELIVKAVIINTGSKTKTFTISASDYTNWASLGSIDKTSISIDAGKSQDVLITLDVNEDISGEKKFNIGLVEGNKFMSQPVSVLIEEQPSTSIPSLTGLFSGIGKGNWYLWGIGALNVLLVLMIIIVAVRVARKKE